LARATGSIETDFLNGEITFLGRFHSIPTPLNAGLQNLASRWARERRRPASMSVDELRQFLQSSA
jgi:2-dehydropantoate 2-reductase